MGYLNFNLIEIYPFIEKEFDYCQNSELVPGNLSLEYKKELWWICQRQHSFQATIQERIDGKNCPICSNPKLHRGINDLATTHPNLAKEWDLQRNGNLKPEDVTKGSFFKIYWICSKCGHSWRATVIGRAGSRGSGCPICARKEVWKKRYEKKIGKNGGIINPKLIQDWDYVKNNPHKPEDYTPHSNKEVWWKCHVCGYSFKDRINNRSKALFCPVCTNRKVVQGYNDLTTTHPEIALQWHPSKNGDLKPTQFSHGNGKKVWWLCPIGHEYKSTILNRTRNSGNGNSCPICDARRHTSFSEQAVFYYVKKYFNDACNRFSADFLKPFELDIFISSVKVAIEYDGKAWHKENLFDREKRKYNLCKEHKIRLIRLKEEKRVSDSETCDRVIYTFWKHDVLNLSIIKLLKEIGIPYAEINVNIERDKYEITKLMDNEYAESFGYKYPQLVKEWHPTRNLPALPTMFSCGTHFKVWWICPMCGNEYQAAIVSRAKGTGCPKCAIHRVSQTKCIKVAKVNLQNNEILEIYNSITEAAKACGLKSSSNITSVCKGKKASVGGFGWKYID